jgi:hypothetical protein
VTEAAAHRRAADVQERSARLQEQHAEQERAAERRPEEAG